jgi:K+-sensing histidine kinase KdpD
MADRSKTAIDSARLARRAGRGAGAGVSTGLGLWLAQSTMRRLGGSISDRNRAAGGAEFQVEFLLGADGQALPQDRASARRPERTARRG